MCRSWSRSTAFWMDLTSASPPAYSSGNCAAKVVVMAVMESSRSRPAPSLRSSTPKAWFCMAPG